MGSAANNMDLDQLFTQAEELETACEFERVVEIAKEILKVDGENIRALLLGAGGLVSKGEEADDKLAKEWYQKAIDLEPDEGYDKYFALAQIVEGSEAISLYEKGIHLLDKSITRSQKGEEKDKLKSDKLDAVRSLVEVFINDMEENASVYLNKARELILKLLKDDSNRFTSYDIFLLAQVYDKHGNKYKSEMKELCEAATRRVTTEEAEDLAEEELGAFLSKFASFCLDHEFLNVAKHVINRLGLVGGKTTDYLSLKALFYRLQCNRMLKKSHFYADSCLELMEEIEEDEPDTAEDNKEAKEAMEELKNKTPAKLEKLFADKSETDGDEKPEEDLMDEHDDDEDSEAESDDDTEFPLTSKPISAKRYQKLIEAEKKRILELCKLDISLVDGLQEMDIEN